MGLMQGKVVGDSIVVMDSFALPVQGTETRVNAASEGYEYMVEYLENSKKGASCSLGLSRKVQCLCRSGDSRTLSDGTIPIINCIKTSLSLSSCVQRTVYS